MQPAYERLQELYPSAAISCIETQGALHATGLAADLATDTELVVVIGGDGTLHDVVQGIMQAPCDARPVLAQVAVGTGNDFARTLGLPADPLATLDMFASAKRLRIDIGSCTSVDDGARCYFLETMSFGVDAAVALKIAELKTRTRMHGTALYARAALSAIMTELKPFHAAWTAHSPEGELDGSSTLLICAIQNGPSYGGGFQVAPEARITDGMLDICMVKRVSTLKALYYLLRIKAGTHEKLPACSCHKVQGLEITLDRRLPLQCDGEQQQGTHFVIEVLPAALEVLVCSDSPALLR
jgi:YegS/Rv2252/BmrU family lipid kinase